MKITVDLCKEDSIEVTGVVIRSRKSAEKLIEFLQEVCERLWPKKSANEDTKEN